MIALAPAGAATNFGTGNHGFLVDGKSEASAGGKASRDTFCNANAAAIAARTKICIISWFFRPLS